MAYVLIGISSWADRSLVASGFYPQTIKTPADRLHYYSQHFPVAEIDASYHHFPTQYDLDLWLSSAANGFVFDLKAFSLFTGHPTPFGSLSRSIRDEFGSRITAKGNIYLHHLPPEAIESLWQGFARTAETIRLAGKLGAILFQFPPWFHPESKNFDYLARCRERLTQYPLAMEFRYDAWFNETNRENTLQFLREHKITLVCVDEPQGFRSSLPPLAEVTAPLGFVRFHGRNRETWEEKGVADEKFKYLYKESELNEWVPRIRDMARQAEELHVIFKNKYCDFPIRNARQFSHMLGIKTENPII